MLESPPSHFPLGVRGWFEAACSPLPSRAAAYALGIPGQAQKMGKSAQRPRGVLLSTPEPSWAGLGSPRVREESPFLCTLAPAPFHLPPPFTAVERPPW